MLKLPCTFVRGIRGEIGVLGCNGQFRVDITMYQVTVGKFAGLDAGMIFE